MFLGLLISRGDIELPVRSPDLTQYEYFVWLLQGTEVFKRHPRNLLVSNTQGNPTYTSSLARYSFC